MEGRTEGGGKGGRGEGRKGKVKGEGEGRRGKGKGKGKGKRRRKQCATSKIVVQWATSLLAGSAVAQSVHRSFLHSRHEMIIFLQMSSTLIVEIFFFVVSPECTGSKVISQVGEKWSHSRGRLCWPCRWLRFLGSGDKRGFAPPSGGCKLANMGGAQRGAG